ncbi:uncharacterized protein LOC128238399 isoform X3 [Mya arenaria]|uniref:uncharacterized protein LOC128238399 isoform X3 n=1 Tax=Mya arenaria TaxID=6604 RepID=UPI0022E62E4B|nr:uncharacterized protein LOC128238399 isoform X3 [Mya arenaria]
MKTVVTVTLLCLAALTLIHTAVGQLPPCNEDTFCPVETTQECFNNSCQCRAGYSIIGSTCKQVCSAEVPSCSSDNEQCDANVCECITGYTWVAGVCQRDGYVEGACLTNQDVKCLQGNTTCQQDVCRCVFGYSLTDRNSDACIQDGTLDGECLPDDQCRVENSECTPDNGCQCADGYSETVPQLCINNGEVNGVCVQDDPTSCSNDGTFCDTNSLCMCKANYTLLYNDNGYPFCIAPGRAGGLCLPETEASRCGPESECSAKGMCDCVAGYTLVNVNCRRDGYPRGVCLTTDPPCVVPNSICNANNKCACGQNYTRISIENCVTDCGVPSNITNGIAEYVKNEEYLRVEAVYTCNTGYVIVGASVRPCQEDGTYAGTEPVCELETPTTTTMMPTTTTTLPAISTVPPLPTCDPPCENQGTCSVNPESSRNECLCLEGFSGSACETEDLCVTQPCPSNARGCVTSGEPLQRSCICAVGYKGNNCDLNDTPITCQNLNTTLRLDLNPPKNSLCLPKIGTSSTNVCHNPDEGVVYELTPPADPDFITEADGEEFCLTYINENPPAPTYCVDMIAFEADDRSLRPWINATARVCFVLNSPPAFQGPTSLLYNVADMLADAVGVTLNATDLEGQTIHYSILSAPGSYGESFSVSGNYLTIQMPTAGIPETGVSVTVTLQLSDNGIPSLTASGDMEVQFINSSITCTVLPDPLLAHVTGDDRPSQALGQITCTKNGAGLTPTSFSVIAESSPVAVDASGSLTYNTDWTESGTSTVNVKVTAEVNDVSLSTNVAFSVIVGDLLPICSIPASLTFSEKAPVNDTCSGVKYSCTNLAGVEMTCSENGNIPSLFNLDCTQAESGALIASICVAEPLDQKFGTYNFSNNVTNTYGQFTMQFSVTVVNINDPPKIRPSVPGASVEEISLRETASGAVITLVVEDPDVAADPPDTLTATLEDPAGSAQSLPFTANISEEQNAVSVVISRQLDPKMRNSYILTLKVTDSVGAASSLTLNITITDINSAPTCPNGPISASASVNDGIGYEVARVACTDADFTAVFSSLTYSLSGDANVISYFNVNEAGSVQLAKSLSDITMSDTTLTFDVVAADGGGLSSSVTINLEVNNSFPPTCANSVYDFLSTKAEDILANVCFDVATACSDPVKGETLTYAISSGNGTEFFTLNSDATATTGNKISLCTLKALKNHYGIYVLNGAVSSSYGERIFHVTITVSDVNDPPTFINTPFAVQTPENTSIGNTILVVSATDPDSGQLGSVTYYSQGLDVSQLFALNSNTGAITLTNSLDADTAADNTYIFTVTAIDGAPSSLEATATVTIEVVDINDKVPSCSQMTPTVNVDLLAPVGFVVTALQCTDGDRSPAFRQIEYTLLSPAQGFAVNQTGHVTLSSSLPRDVTSYVVRVKVRDSNKANDPAFSVEVVITVAVNTEFGPVCTPAAITKVLPENAVVGSCLDNELTCTDPTSVSVTLVAQTGSALGLLEIRSHSSTGQMGLNACIKSSLRNQFGQYELVGTVSNGLANSTITWKLTVTNINDAPVFSSALYNITVDENMPADTNKALLVLEVKDPDDGQGNPDFELKEVRAQLTNNADFKDAMSGAILFFPSVRSFFTTVTLDATIRNLFLYNVTATDGLGKSTETRVEIHVRDLNSAPSCNPVNYQATTDILAAPGHVLQSLTCTDGDRDPDNIRLNYNITSGDQNNYFNMTSSGDVIVSQNLPRTKLYGTGSTTLQVRVEDYGSPRLGTSVSVYISVNNVIGAECTVGVTPPDIWVQGKCVDITMDCTDPTTTSNNHLTYESSGNITLGFTVPVIAQNRLSTCYELTTSGKYEIVIDVYNGLTKARFREIIEVSYAQATPVFGASKYITDINETAVANVEVFKVTATSANLIGQIVYRITEGTPAGDWGNYFALDSSTGTISATKDLQPLANLVYSLTVVAEDTGSKLSSDTTVQINIIDINEPPTCTTKTETIDVISVDASVGTVVTAITCVDGDIKLEYKTLTYQLDRDSSPFELMNNGTSKLLVTKALLDVTVAKYDVSVLVADGGGLSIVKDIAITVNLLPPPVMITVKEVGYNNAIISWSYVREDYVKVTGTFTISVRLTGGESTDVTIRASLSAMSRYEIRNLLPESQYTVTVAAVTAYGRSTSQQITIQTTEVPVFTHLAATVRYLAANFDPRLRDLDSQLYYATTQNVLSQLEFVLKQPQFKGFYSVKIMGFRPANSLYVDFIVSVNQSGSATETLQLLNSTVQTGWLGNISVDSTYFVAIIGEGYVDVAQISVTPSEVFNNTDVKITCLFNAIGYPSNATITYWWTFKDVMIQPTSLSRYSITNSVPNALIYEGKMSILSITPMLRQHEGKYACHIRGESGQQTDSASLDVAVISQPVVSISPREVTVDYGRDVILVCREVTPYLQLLWYKDDAEFQPSDNDLDVQESNATLTIRNIQVNSVYGCAGRNKAGIGARSRSFVNVRPNALQSIVCPQTTGINGATWPESAAGATVRINCPTGFTGEVYRVCNTVGSWGPPIDSCVSDSLQDIENTVTDIQDGSSTANLTNLLADLDEATSDTDLYQGELETALTTLDNAGQLDTGEDAGNTEAENFLKSASNLIGQRNKPTWESRIESSRKGAIDVPRVVEQFINQRFNQTPDGQTRTLTSNNIHVKIGRGKQNSDYVFPDRSSPDLPDWLKESGSGIRIPAQSFNGLSTLNYASSFYRNITSILVTRLKRNNMVEEVSGELELNSDIVAFQIQEDIAIIDPPAEITFRHFDANYSNPICCFWDFESESFVTDGCELVSTNDEQTVCACNHFTNFAILMSPGKAVGVDALALSIISAVGCAISIFCLLLTVAAYLLVWRYVKSDRAVLLLNLCASLIISYILFLAGVGRSENQTVCTVISALLHYFYLVVFFMMLAYGVEIAISIIYVFAVGSRLKWLIPAAWGIPAVIVGISMGVTELEGYGNEEFCWLSTEDGVLWAFVGPALLVIVINFIIVIAVIRKMFTSSAMMTKSDKEKAWLGIRSVCVLVPIMGLTWVFGVFSVNENMVAFQYIFAICNSLQGLLIFIFHCVLNKQLKDGLKQRSKRKKSLATFEQSYNKQSNQHSTGEPTGFTGIGDSKSTSNSNELEKATTNPFLEADRQMKELTKTKKGGTANLCDNNVITNNKLDKGAPGARAVDLDDVKISNILRESEVMSGTAGISSILPKPERRQPEQTGSRTPEEQRKFVKWFLEENAARKSQASHNYDHIRQSQASSHRYESIDLGKDKNVLQTPGSGEYLILQPSSQLSASSRESGSNASKEKKGEQVREKEREKERQQKIEKVRKEEEKQRKDFEKREKERREKERKERERYEREHKERERQERNKQPYVTHIGYGREDPNNATNKPQPSISRSSRSDDDYEARVVEHRNRMTTVYLPYASPRRVTGQSGSGQNISSIATALPQKYDQHQGKNKKGSTSSSKKTDSLPKKEKGGKKPKGGQLRDRSRAYEYSYDTTYLGGSSRHASLENMNMQHQYGPYGHMPGMSGYQTGRPTHQQQHWDQYHYPQDQYGRSQYW